MKYQLPKLPYDYSALEPYIDTKTMKIHHLKHHNGYVDKLNGMLEKYPGISDEPLEKILMDISKVPLEIQSAVRNNGGGHCNHSLFWQIMSPVAEVSISRDLAYAIDNSFGSFDKFKEIFTKAAATKFGSGWVWLVVNEKKLGIVSSSNQDNPLAEGKIPILVIDVWEHAYYLKYQNRRTEYIKNWWNVVNWQVVSEKYQNAID